MRYFILLSYNGAAFCGWQIQPDAPSVQQTLGEALSVLLHEKVEVTGAGRTDTGVSAIGYTAHFDTLCADVQGEGFRCKLNAILNKSVVVHAIFPDPRHARFDAVRREYPYFLHRSKDPFVADRSWLCTYPLDFEAMNRAAALLAGTHDFSCFEKTGGNRKTPVCTVYEARWVPYEPDHVRLMGYPGGTHWYFRIAANRFLRNMVRAVVGSLIEVGRGRFAPEWIGTLLDGGGTRSDAGTSVPGHALFLSGVSYGPETDK